VGYGPPPDKFLERLEKSLSGEETYRTLSAAYDRDPKNVEVAFKLAQKCENRYTTEMTDKAKALYEKVIALDPEGKAGSTTFDYVKASVPYTEAAQYALGRMVAFGRKPDPAPLRGFIAKYPNSALVKQAYSYLSNYYQYYASQEDAAKFFDEYTARYPEDAAVLNSYVERIIKDKAPLDKGLDLAEKIKAIVGYPPNADYMQNLAQLYALKGDVGKADEVYGKDFISSYISNAVSALTGYADFWIGQGKNLDSVEAMADLAAELKPDQWYTLQTVADIYLKLNKDEKALTVFGPALAKKNWDERGVLASYAAFWNRQSKNLTSALEAAERAVELAGDYYNYFILGQVQFKLKNYPEALQAAEKAVELAKPLTVKYEGFTTKQYDDLVKQIKDAMAKGKGAEA
jgi:tetratricopeptide (TPR) repeat protein